MNRRQFLALPLLLALLSLAASVWEGSAIVGGADDFPNEGLFGACNSFPRDASVQVRNLENGKTVTVVITKNVDNPGVFIALSPKAAADLGMRQGSAARVRATTLSLSMPESTLPAARAGQTADPDFNPKVFVDREKAALAAAAPAIPAASAVPPEAAATLIAAATSIPPQPEPIAEPIAEPSAEPSAEPAIEGPLSPEEALILALEDEAEPAGEVVKLPPDDALAAEAASSETGEPRPELLSVELPTPDILASQPTAEPPSARNFPTNLPEAIGGDIPKPRPASTVKAYLPEPSFVAKVVAANGTIPTESSAPIVLSTPESASVEALERPELAVKQDGVALAEPQPTFAPDELPEELLPRLTEPRPTLPEFALAEIELPRIAEAEPSQGPEAFALDRPEDARGSAAEGDSPALATPAVPYPAESLAADSPALSSALAYENGLDEPEAAVRMVESPELDQGPMALVAEAPSTALLPDADLEDPETPSPSESLATERPASEESLLAEISLEEPGLPYIEESEPALALGLERPDNEKGDETEIELGEPGLPAPEENLAIADAERLLAAEGAELGEPGIPVPDESIAMAEAEPLLAAEHEGDLGEPGIPAPDADLAGERPAPAAAAGGDIVVSLEPTSPRPPEPGKAEAAASVAIVPEKPAPGAAAAASAVAAIPVPDNVPLIAALASGSYYVQIGVYGTGDSLRGAVRGFQSTYPLAMEKVKAPSGPEAYRLYVGPLSRDESGLVLYRIKSMGFRDAFVKQGS